MDKITFRDWLIQQSDRHDLVGNLAYEMLQNDCISKHNCCLRAKTYKGILNHINKKHLYNDPISMELAKKSLQLAYEEYLSNDRQDTI